MGKLFFVGVTIAIPILFLLYAIVKKSVRPLFLGVVAFVGSQIIIRIPILQLLATTNSTYQFLMITKPILMILLLSLSAGVMEELARWIMMRAFLKKRTIQQGIFFGFGHGGIEAILIVGIPVILQFHLVSASDVWLSGIERILAMTMHICLSVIVLMGVSKKQFRYVAAAIAIHTSINFSGVYMARSFSPVLAELTLALLTCLLVGWTIQLCRRNGKNEKENRDFM